MNQIKANRGNIYEVKYVISSEWWKKWLNYVKFYDLEETSVQDSFETSPIREEGNFSHPGKILNRLFAKILYFFLKKHKEI